MHIVIVNAVFPPEPVVSAKIGLDLAKYFRSCGHKVTVLCPYPTRPISATYYGWSERHGIDTRHEDYGATVVRLPSFTSPKSSLIGRIYESWSFGRHASLFLKNNLGEFDIVYANTWPFFSQIWIGSSCKKLKKPLVFHVQDLYPESFLARIPKQAAALLSPLLFAFERYVSRMAFGAIVISRGFRDAYLRRRNVQGKAVKIITNWIDEQPFEQAYDRKAACLEYDVPLGMFTFLYFGNVGPVAGVELLISAFNSANISNAQLVIAGDGSAKKQCVNQAKKIQNKNVYFITDPDASAAPKIQSLADVCLLPVKKGQASSSVPSKLMVYMMSGKPVLAAVDSDSETSTIIQESHCGWLSPPEDGKRLASLMQEVAGISKEELQERGSESQTYAKKSFSRKAGVEQVASYLRELVDKFNKSSSIAING